jgi:hypothetical protein
MAWQGRAPRQGEKLQALMHAGCQSSHSEQVNPRGRQLDSERVAVQSFANLGDDRYIRVFQLERVAVSASTLDEQLNGRVGQSLTAGQCGRARG